MAAFTGRAIYDASGTDQIFANELAEDVSDIIGMISPYETPLLDILGNAPFSATNVLHEWLEDSLAPNTMINSIAIGSLATDTPITLAENADLLQVGHVLIARATGEYMQVVSVGTGITTITVSRGFASTTATSLGANATLDLVSEVTLEGEDVVADTSRIRLRKNNYCQIFKKDIIISGTDEAVRKLGGIGSEMDYQRIKKTREILRDLEKAIIRNRLSGNTIGSSTKYRTLGGLAQKIATNIVSIGALSETLMGDALGKCWNYGAKDIDIILTDIIYRRTLNSWNASSSFLNVAQSEETIKRVTTEYESAFGTQRIALSRWMYDKNGVGGLMGLASNRIKVLPLQGRSFGYVPIAKTGDSEKGMIIGEYTMEVKNEEGLVRTRDIVG